MRLSKFRVIILSSVLLTLTMLAAEGMQAQTFTILYSFNLADGSAPEAGLSMDRAGNLYGTASEGGSFQGECSDAGCGTVFELIHRNSSWVFSPLYTFTGSGGKRRKPGSSLDPTALSMEQPLLAARRVSALSSVLHLQHTFAHTYRAPGRKLCCIHSPAAPMA